METKLCRGCDQVLPINMFGIRTQRRKTVRISRCKKCCNVELTLFKRMKKEQAGGFVNSRLYDPERDARLDEHRKRAKLGLPMICGGTAIVELISGEYHNFYEGK